MAPYEIAGPHLIPDLPERIAKGEFKLPLYADLPGMPEHERRAIWGLMIPHEGKCWIIYDTYTKAGFDPDKDMLQAPVMPPEQYISKPWWTGMSPRQWRDTGFCGGGCRRLGTGYAGWTALPGGDGPGRCRIVV